MDMIDFKDPKKINEYLVDKELYCCIPFEVRKDVFPGTDVPCLRSDDLDLTIVPQVAVRSSDEIDLYVTALSKKYPRGFFMYKRSQDKDLQTALGSSLTLVKTAFIPAIKKLMDQDAYTVIETEFEGKKHSWKVYVGDILTSTDSGASDSNKDRDQIIKSLLPELAKRLGDQKSMDAYIKIGNFLKGATCYVDGNFVVRELADKAREMSSLWPNTVKELYLIFEQDDSTYSADPNINFEKWPFYLKSYLDLCRTSEGPEMSDKDITTALTYIGDPTFVYSCRAFLPDLTAGALKSARLSSNSYPDKVEIYTADGIKHDVYLTQLSDYIFLRKEIRNVVNQLGNNDPAVRKLFDSSQLVRYLNDNNIPVDNSTITFGTLKYNMGEGYKFR